MSADAQQGMLQDQEYAARFSGSAWKRLFAFTAGKRHYVVGLLVCLLFLSALEIATPLLTKYAIDTFVGTGSIDGLPWFILVFLLVIAGQATMIRFFILMAGYVEVHLSCAIRSAGFRKLQALDFSYYDRTPTGWIISRMIQDASRLSEIIAWGITDIVWASGTLVFLVAAMFILNWKLALLALAVVPALAVVSLYFQRKLLKAHRRIRRQNSRITSGFNEGIMGAKASKTMRRETNNLGEFKELTDDMYKFSVRAAILSSLYMPVVSLLGAVGTALVLWKGGTDVAEGLILMGTLYVFVSYVQRFFEPIRHISRLIAELQSAQAAAERVLSLLAEEPRIIDQPDVLKTYGFTDGAGEQAWPDIHGDITFDDVTFSYRGGESVLKNFSLDVGAGQVIALVGETGAGKSTIVNLLCRFYEPTSGRILIDGKNYTTLPMNWLYSSLGYVLQSPHLFSGSIADNIRYGRLDATQEEIEEAARMVSAHAFIEQTEDGYDTEVGEGGNRLSTGEKQLISFARAILANPRIFVLDEATSSVDTETEQLIQHAITQVLQGRTSFVVAHRLSTIRNADRILVISDGRVIEEGSHKELMHRHGHYRDLYLNQFLQESVDHPLN